METIKGNYLESVIKLFTYYKGLGEQTISVLSESQLLFQPNPESNSIGIIVNHLSGNMLSRWSDFLSSDGEKSFRNRDREFEQILTTQSQIIEAWDKGWECLLNTLNSLNSDDLAKIIYIRNEGHTVSEAINRQLGHYAYHIGQIVYLGRMCKGADWKSLSIPKGKSASYNKDKFSKTKSKKHFTDDV